MEKDFYRKPQRGIYPSGATTNQLPPEFLEWDGWTSYGTKYRKGIEYEPTGFFIPFSMMKTQEQCDEWCNIIRVQPWSTLHMIKEFYRVAIRETPQIEMPDIPLKIESEFGF